MSGSTGGSSEFCSVRAIAERWRYCCALSIATAARRPSSSSTASCSAPRTRPDVVITSVIAPSGRPRTDSGTFAELRTPSCMTSSRWRGSTAARRRWVSSTCGWSSLRPVRATAAGPSVPDTSTSRPSMSRASPASAGSAWATAMRSRPRSPMTSTMHQSASSGTASDATWRSVSS